MKRYIYTLIIFFSLLFPYPCLYSQQFDTALEDDSTFITIMLHGLDRYLTWQDNPPLYQPENYEPLGERSREFGINNIFHYNFANMSRHNSNDLIREIGDFNTGSFIISERYSGSEQPFISLARCEWVYRHSPALRKALGYAPGKYPWWLEGDEKDSNSGLAKMRVLLTLGPHFADFLMVPTELDSQNNLVPKAGAFEYLKKVISNKIFIDILNRELGTVISFSPADLEAMAKEFYQLASGNYYDDPELAASVGGNKCPSTIRIVTHSMGGMMVSRYVAETENLFNDYEGKKGTHGFYQRNLDYTLN
jgi:hypothetical protein